MKATSTPRRKFQCYSYHEARDGLGRVVNFSSESGDAPLIADAIGLARDIDPVVRTHGTHTGEGLLVHYSRYSFHRHRYAGSQSGFIELLEIKDAPDGRHPIVLFARPTWDEGYFTEWASVEDGDRAFERIFSRGDRHAELHALPGFIRLVPCGVLQPWFLAVGNEDLINDYALPFGMEDDPVFRMGGKFVCRVYERNEFTHIVKTCLGTRLILNEYNKAERCIQWDDGSIDVVGHTTNIRPLRENEQWIEDAVVAFRRFLNGGSDAFEIPLFHGMSFRGKLTKKKDAIVAPGRYHVVLKVAEDEKPKQGWYTFKPTPDAPDLIMLLQQKCALNKWTVERIEVIGTSHIKNGNKWCGVWYDATTELANP